MLQDLRYGWRWLRRSPGFTLVATLSLGVGIGANAALFSVVDATLFRPPAVAGPERLVNLYTSGTDGDPYATFSYQDYRDLAAEARVFEDVAAFSMMLAPLNLEGRSRLILGELVTGNYFPLLGVRAALGRTLLPEDDSADAERVVTVSDRYWRRELGARADVLGQRVRLRGETYTVVGVIASSFSGSVPLVAAELWVPVRWADDVEPGGIIDAVPSPGGTGRLDRRGYRWLFVKGRLRPGASLAEAQAHADVVMGRLRLSYPDTNKDRRITAIAASQVRVHPAVDRVMLPIGLGLLALVGLVLVIACANLASMLLARAAARQREIGIRLAVGAGRGRLVRQLLTESTLLGLLGAIAGAMITWGLARALAAAPQALPIAVNVAIELDLRVWGFLLAVSLAAGMAAGLAPALRVTRVDLVADLKGSQAIRAIGTRWALRDLLVAGQMALTTLLIVAAGLLVRSLLSATGADTGFRHHGLAIVSTDPEMARYDEAGARQLLDRARARIATLPGVTGVATATRVPFSLNFTESQFLIAGHERAEGRGWTVLNAGVSPEYFQVLGVPIVQGRGFSTADGATSAKVAVVSEAMARRFWPEEGAIGRQLRLSNRPAETIEVVGVAGDHLVRTVGEEPQPYVYFPLEQRWNSAQILVARTDGDPRGLVSHMERELLALEPNLVLIDNQTMDDQMATMLLPARAGALVALAGGLTALGLAALGLYGVMAYSVAGRTREIGIRMAVGASRGAVVALVLRKGLSIAAAGLAAGGLLATLAAQGAAGMLYGITAADPVAWVAAVGLLGAVSVLANLLPVRRALAIDPLLALRAD